MKKLSNIFQVILAITAMIALVVMSYMNESIFMDRILPCCFILGVIILARFRNGVNRVVPDKKIQ
ncbi:hypothetical protein [Flagellimonas okinawensis]|uniref:Uncharacterized protein n=1 Tax=Flagellimonas okinawensis TaxID=3031324 RepID=A0ABT5XPX3_9FLAO|nr:hypothetical protein [[Muricauda] okinawensis]MDF0707847.1 hypothetical protein [[Muricauda] okinawensis]